MVDGEACAGCETPGECARMGCAQESGAEKAHGLLQELRLVAAKRRRRRESHQRLVEQLPVNTNCMFCDALSLRTKGGVYQCTGCGVRLRVDNPATWLKWITEYEKEAAG